MKHIVFATLLVACSSDPSVLEPGGGDSPGTGTNTLVVDGTVRASARAANAQTPADFDTEFSVQVQLNNAPVTTGTVTVTSATGEVALQYQPNGDRAGRWTGSAPGYDEVYVLDVISGDDRVVGVRVDGPDAHRFTAPLAGATVDSTMPLDVAWDRAETADSTTIRAERLDDVSIADTGTFSLPAGALKAEQDKARTNTIRITRTNRVTPAGTVGASQVGVTITNDIDVIAQPDPTL